MSWIRTGAIGLGGLLGVGVLGVGATYLWASSQVEAVFAKTWETRTADFPVPFPLTDDEVAALRAEADSDADLDLDAIALERAIARGQHFTESIYACTACHGADFGGGVMLSDPAIGEVRGPNLTPGGVVADYTVADWSRAVRHGVLPDGTTSIMPVRDYKNLSDRELSDIVAYLGTLPAKEGGETVRTWGPVGTMLIATGQLVPDAYVVPDHHAAQAELPPPVAPDLAYGTHITTVCVGCHRETLAGGPMPFGPPDWPPAANLTPHAAGLAGWTFEQFDTLMRRGVRPDGTTLKPPMSEMIPFAANFTEVEMQAMYTYIAQVPALPTGE